MIPSICVEGSSPSDHFRCSSRSGAFSSRFSPPLPSMSIPMSIPGSSSEREVPPPPLPPPRFPLEAEGGYRRREPLSAYGSLEASLKDDDRPSFKQRPARDEGYASLGSSTSTRSRDSLPRFGISHERTYGNLVRESANKYDSSLLAKLDSRRTRDSRSPPRRPVLITSLSDMATRGGQRDGRGPPPFQASLPILPGRHALREQQLDTTAPQNGARYGAGSQDYRSPIEASDGDLSPLPRSRRTNSSSLGEEPNSFHGSSADDIEYPMADVRRLNIEDPHGRFDYQTVGQKRRASSPPSEEPLSHGGGELLRRRDANLRASPAPRLSIPQGPVPSVSRNGSYSGMSGGPSYSRLSPGGLSPGGLSPVATDPGTASPYATPISLTQSPRAPIIRAPHQRTVSEQRSMSSPRKLNEIPKSSVAKMQGFFMCECCPKKPKKFETTEELRAHEAEKQYECAYCGNRFKNKNEAERHQNSLHVRRHSWSCSALSGYDRAFHDSTNRPGEADTCGYCGEEFMRSGGPGRVKHATEQDWDDRIRHLQEVHKFGECNGSKKFYRADHFRQHLKHSHAGTSGKWTNMLENACMIEEEPSPR